jgi:hypothetical protein
VTGSLPAQLHTSVEGYIQSGRPKIVHSIRPLRSLSNLLSLVFSHDFARWNLIIIKKYEWLVRKSKWARTQRLS